MATPRVVSTASGLRWSGSWLNSSSMPDGPNPMCSPAWPRITEQPPNATGCPMPLNTLNASQASRVASVYRPVASECVAEMSRKCHSPTGHAGRGRAGRHRPGPVTGQ